MPKSKRHIKRRLRTKGKLTINQRLIKEKARRGRSIPIYIS